MKEMDVRIFWLQYFFIFEEDGWQLLFTTVLKSESDISSQTRLEKTYKSVYSTLDTFDTDFETIH